MRSFFRFLRSFPSWKQTFTFKWITVAISGLVALGLGQISLVQAPLALAALVNGIGEGASQSAGLMWIGTYAGLMVMGHVLFEVSDVAWFSVTERVKSSLVVPTLTKLLQDQPPVMRQGPLQGSHDSTGAIYEIVDRGVQAIAMTIDAVAFRIIPKALMLIIIVVTIASRFSPLVALAAFIGCLVYVAWISGLHRFVVRLVHQLSARSDAKTSSVMDALQNRRVFGVYEGAFNLLQKVQAAVEANRKASVRLVAFQSMWFAGNSIIIALVTASALAVFVYQPQAVEDVGGLVALTYLVGMIFAPVGDLSSGVQTALTERAKSKELEQLVGRTRSRKPVQAAPCDWSEIRLQHFQACDVNETPLHRPVSLAITRGDKVVISGPSGVGKTTLLEALVNPAVEHQGSLQIGRAGGGWFDIDSLSGVAAYVPQQDLLFNVPIQENITFGLPGAMDLRSVVQASAISGTLAERILSDHTSGEAGASLSGGERRRVIIARGLYMGASLLVMDEPLSGLDVKTQRQLMNFLLDRERDLTVLMVCHHAEWWPHFDVHVRMDAVELEVS